VDRKDKDNESRENQKSRQKEGKKQRLIDETEKEAETK
jgi:hypothetical protein